MTTPPISPYLSTSIYSRLASSRLTSPSGKIGIGVAGPAFNYGGSRAVERILADERQAGRKVAPMRESALAIALARATNATRFKRLYRRNSIVAASNLHRARHEASFAATAERYLREALIGERSARGWLPTLASIAAR